MLYVVILVAILLLCLGIHRYFNLDNLTLKYPSIIYLVISFILYFVAILQYRVDSTMSEFLAHEILVTTIFGLLIFWTLSQTNKTKDTVVYTILIIIASIGAVLTRSPQFGLNASMEMLIVRMVLTTALAVGLGGYVLYRQLKKPVSESFPLLYILAFAYWVMVAFWM
ncbi:hypothetical protein [Staphylococcus carnosus]|uniref:Transmembrane protein n=2 Tax=Staphylococcus carnosus TaxID=1281 RepID=B9DLW3_STACT|nr:hypothetical protein [Staphylococcus carnosus]AAB94652.1 putative transmembrane protein [Staphylococcus carnosus]ANZ32707.1 hypothetical protein BEK99_02070 [Staphylococcus carnosus]KOR12837.1 hypothetical protein AMC75_06125 [Staphylococcus carnosus]QPT04784.1 hypothetical protein I6G40_04985 [Staphylococcus carnosus]UQA67509.1 hypothetical protein Sta3580_01015 [Staphylococcus carnosus]